MKVTTYNIEQARTLVEKIMVQLPPETRSQHKQFLAGYIECLAETHCITEEDRETLYNEYT